MSLATKTAVKSKVPAKKASAATHGSNSLSQAKNTKMVSPTNKNKNIPALNQKTTQPITTSKMVNPSLNK